MQPRAAGAYLGIVGAKKVTAADTTLIERMQTLLEERSLGEEERCSLHYALGKAFCLYYRGVLAGQTPNPADLKRYYGEQPDGAEADMGDGEAALRVDGEAVGTDPA